jgi:nitrogen-specific signal transduction histidine kinase/CheY-like chemotaxis protein
MRGKIVGRDEEGRPTRMAGVAADVTERRRLQGQLDLSQRMAGLGRLAAGVAHEINNPLSSVIANLAWISDELPAPSRELAQALAEARDGAKRVAEVVRGLKSFSRPGPAQRGPVDVRRELDAALRLAHHELRHRAVVEVRIGELPAVVAEAHELAQVFLNLLVNAAQAIPEGRAEEHRVEVDARTDAEGWAAVSIRDTGVGIPPDVLGRIFEPFFTTKPLGVGTGLGLAISHGIVTEAGGRLEVESRVGHGSTFRVLLPPATGVRPAETEGPAVDKATAAGERSGRPRVLVIDDEVLVARAVVRALGEGYEVSSCTSAREALGRLEAGERFDAVLCDLMMPQMSGMELYARTARFAPETASRFVFVTGGAFTEAGADFLRTTTNGWIEKPFESHAIREAVDRVVGR